MLRLTCLFASLVAHAGVATLIILPRPDTATEQGIKGADTFEIAAVDLATFLAPTPPAPPPSPTQRPDTPKDRPTKNNPPAPLSPKPAQAETTRHPPRPKTTATPAQAAPLAREKGLSDEAKAAVEAWQRSVVLMISAAKTYPASARKARHEGQVIVSFTMDRNGTVLSQNLRKSSGHADLDTAALSVLETLRHLPPPPKAIAGGTINLAVPFNYSLKDQAAARPATFAR